MSEKDDDGRLQQGRESAQQLHQLFAQIQTPGLRFFLAAGMLSGVYSALADALNNKLVSREHVTEIVAHLDKFKLFDDPPANFVDMLATLYRQLELSKERDDFDERHEIIVNEIQLYLHSIAFSPPQGLPLDPKDVAGDLTDLASFVNELRAETDRGAALVGAALIDDRLERLLKSQLLLTKDLYEKLLSGAANAPLGHFAARTSMCRALGLITEVEYKECVLIAKIRNMFAHRLHGLTFETSEIADRCKQLAAMPYEKWGKPRQRYINSVVTLSLVLWHRSAHAADCKARERSWPWHLALTKKPADGKPEQGKVVD